MISNTRSAVAAISLSAVAAVAVAACTATGEPVTDGASGTALAAEGTQEAAPRMGAASAALQTGVSTTAVTRAPQRPAPVPPPPATGPSIAAAHSAPATLQSPLIPEPAPAPAQASAPAARPSAPAPAAAAPAARQASLGAAEVAEGRRLFNAFSCGACHVLADAEASGHVGPALDGNAALTRDFVINVVTNGRGAMPGFGGQMSDEEIALLASYILQVRK